VKYIIYTIYEYIIRWGVVDIEHVLEIVEDAVPEDHEDGAER